MYKLFYKVKESFPFGYLYRFPKLNSRKDDSPEVLMNKYVVKARELLGDYLDITYDEGVDESASTITLSTDVGKVYIWCHGPTVGFDVEGADTGYWNTFEHDVIDEYFWVAIGLLRKGVTYFKSPIGFEQAWMYCDEAKLWVVTPKKYHTYGYTKFTRRSPRKLKSS